MKLPEPRKTAPCSTIKVVLSVFSLLTILSIPCSNKAAEIYIDRTGVRQLNFANLTDGTMNDSKNDPEPYFNWYIDKTSVKNPLRWTHIWSMATPSDGTIPMDADETFTGAIAAELFPVIWDIDYPVSTEDDRLYWDKIPYGGPNGAGFSLASNPAAIYVARVQGNNNYWGAKRLSLDPTLIPENQVQYFWLQVDAGADATNWKSSIDYSDLAIIFNPGDFSVSKTATVVSGFDPPRVGHTTVYRMRVNISNPTLTSSGGPMYDVQVKDKFPAGSTIVTNPSLGSATIDAAGNLVWNVGILQDGALNTPPAAGSTDFLEVQLSITPTTGQTGTPIVLNTGATISGNQTPLDPGDGTGTLYPFNYHGSAADKITGVSTVLATANVTPANSGTISSTPSIHSGDSITITVTDPDINLNAAVAETVSVTATNVNTGETETVVCTETGPDTGVFIGMLSTVYGTSAGTNDSGVMNVQAGVTVRARYNDAVALNGLPASLTSDTSVTGGIAGTIISTVFVAPGGMISVTITDQDLNNNAATTQTVVITATNQSTGETENITCTESGVNSSSFTCSLATAFGTTPGANDSGSMNAQAGNIIRFTYSDALTADGGTAVVYAYTSVTGGVSGTITSTVQIIPAGAIAVTVTDADLNTNAGTPQTVVIVAINQTTGETENVTCTENGVNTNVFNCSLATAFGTAAGANNSGSMNVQAGDIVRFTYNDNLTTSGGTASVFSDTSAAGGANGAITASAVVEAGGMISVTVSDADLNTNSATLQTVAISAVNTVTGEIETLTLTETGPATGVFTTNVPTIRNSNPGPNNDGSFYAAHSHAITFTYTDNLNAFGGAGALTATTNVVSTSNFVTITSPVGTLTNGTQNVIGRTNPLSTVSMSDPITEIQLYTVADGAGNYTFASVIFPEGATTYTVMSLDPAGNTAAAAATVYIDSTNSITVVVPPLGSVINDTLVDISGTTDPNSTVTITNTTTGQTVTTTSDNMGNFIITNMTMVEGVNNITATSTDPQGNTVTISATISVNLQITLSITSIAEGGKYNHSLHEIAGITDPNSTVTTTHPGTGALLTTTADATGHYSFGVFSFADGNRSVTVDAIDEAGNTALAQVNFFIDTINTDVILTSGLITTPTVTINGTTDPLSAVVFTHPVNGEVYTVRAAADGTYSFASVPFADGNYTISTTSTDPFGNIATDSSTLTVDASIALRITSPANDSVLKNDVNDISGETDPFAVVTTTDPKFGTPLTTTADAAGNFTFSGVNLLPGVNSMVFTSTDPSGNNASVNHRLAYDPDITLSITSLTDGGIYYTNVLDVTGKTDPGMVVTMYDPTTGAPMTTTSDAQGIFIFEDVVFPEGANTVTVFVTDYTDDTVSASSVFTVRTQGVDAEISASDRIVFGNPIYITVSDREPYWNPAVRDMITVTVTSRDTHDSENVTLIETTVDSGVFFGQLATVERATADPAQSGMLSVVYDDLATTVYTDALRADGSRNIPVHAVTLITNDEIKINVNVVSAMGKVSVEPLSQGNVSILEFDAAGKLTGVSYNYTTDANGYIPKTFIGKMRENHSYTILLKEAFKGCTYVHSTVFDIDKLHAIAPDSRGVRSLVIVLDPAGYVYDAVTGARVDGADVTLYHDGGAAAAGPFTFYTSAPSRLQTNPQLSGDSGTRGGFEFIGSSSGSDITAGNYYITVTFAANPILALDYRPVMRNPSSWSGVSQPYTGQVFRVDIDNQPVGMRIPLVPVMTTNPLSISKNANKEFASSGDIVTYAVTVRNLGATMTSLSHPVVVADRIPPGMTYVKGSAVSANGTPLEIVEEGNALSFVIGQLRAAGDPRGRDSITFYYQTVVDTSAETGSWLKNTAVAEIDSFALSNTAEATVRVIPDPILDTTLLFGKVFEDSNDNGRQDEGETGIAGAKVALDDGTVATADDYGRFSIPGIHTDYGASGYRMVKLDMRSLPAGSKLTTPESVFVYLSPGGTAQADFGCKNDARPANNGAGAKDRFFMFLLDGAVGDVKTLAGEAESAAASFMPAGTKHYGRAAFVFDGYASKGLHVTTTFDSDKKYRYDMNSEKIRELFYPTYGDGSTLSYLSDTQGRFYLKANTKSTDLTYGNYEAEFEDAGVAAIRRTLYGAKYQFRKSHENDSDGITLFTAERKQIHGRVELRSTGGTIYYLPHADISQGSESISIVIKDYFVPEYTKHTRKLKKDTDYEIDYLTGRIRLYSPPLINAESDSIYREGVGSGDPVWIVAEYVYSPLHGDFGTYGARWLHYKGPNVGFGFSLLRENMNGRDHLLRGADFRIKGEKDDILRIEIARSTSGGEQSAASLDGGRSFIDLGVAGETSASAFKSSFNLRFNNGIEWRNYYYAVQPEFTGAAFSEAGVKRGGTSLAYKKDDLELGVNYTRAMPQTAASIAARFSAGEAGYHATRVYFKEYFDKDAFVQAELFRRRDRINDALSKAPQCMSDSVAIRYERKMSDRLNAYLMQQNSLSQAQNSQSTAGINYRMRKDTDFTLEGTIGSERNSGKLGFVKTRSNGARLYADISTGGTNNDPRALSTSTAGLSVPVGAKSAFFMEYGMSELENEDVIRKTVGINRKYDAGGGLRLSMSAERSEESSSLSGGYMTNSAEIHADYTISKNQNFKTGAEYGRSSGSISEELFSFSAAAEIVTPYNLTISSEYLYSVASDLLDRGNTESKYTKSLIGIAYRPVGNERLNLFAKAARIRDMRGAVSNRILLPDSVSSVLSLEGIYNLTPSFSLREKIASKFIKELVSPLPAARAHTILWISGFKYKLSRVWDMDFEFRTRHQPTSFNGKDGIAVETGYIIKDKLRVGLGYNFSSFTDNEFENESVSSRNVFLRLQYKQ